MGKINIGFFADGQWSVRALNIFLKDKNNILIKFICLRFPNPDKSLNLIARKMNIPVLKFKNINSHINYLKLKKFNCDLFVSLSYNQIFKKNILSIPKLKSINCHASQLPFYRGRNVLNWVLINGEKSFGISVHFIDSGIDTGDIILQRKYKIKDTDDYNTLLSKCIKNCGPLLHRSIIQIKKNKAKKIPQSKINKVGSYCRGRIKGDEIINWNQSTNKIFNFIRAVTKPGPLAETTLKKKKIKIISSTDKTRKKIIISGRPGKILSIDDNYIYVKTLNGYIGCILEKKIKDLKIGDYFN